MVNLYRTLTGVKHESEYRQRESLVSKLQKKAYFTDAEVNEVLAYRGVPAHSNASAVKYTTAAFQAENLEDKVRYLKKLNGVGIVMASTILMMENPNRYAEIRHGVWNMLQRNYGLEGGAKDVNSDYSAAEYAKYLELIKTLSDEYGVKPSDAIYALSILSK